MAAAALRLAAAAVVAGAPGAEGVLAALRAAAAAPDAQAATLALPEDTVAAAAVLCVARACGTEDTAHWLTWRSLGPGRSGPSAVRRWTPTMLRTCTAC
jgi:hypothetical protein